MDNGIITKVCAALAGADIICFVLLLGRAVKRITGLSGYKGTLAGIGGAAVFTAVMLATLQSDVRDTLKLHPYIAALVYLLLFLLMIAAFLLILTRRGTEKLTIDQLDELDGTDFEKFCAVLLLRKGFSDIELTKSSGDFGVDILAVRDGLLYGIQCKRYSSRLDSKPVQQVSAGISYYGCNVGAVMTNNILTAHASELAEAAGIEVWDRDVLEAWLKETEG